MALPFAALQDDVSALVSRWRGQRAERQARRTLDPGDFAALRTAGLLRTVVPESADLDGLWRDAPTSTRPIAELLRSIARADPAVALVSAMHPAVIGFWLLNPEPADERWEEQRAAVFASAAAGEQWGTITSEPGSGGDIARTRAVAEPSEQPAPLPGRTYVLTGEKHFGSGSGITDRMITTAVPSGEDAPAFFAIDVRGRPWDGSAGMVLRAEWDGMGMAATQSHAMLLDRVPAVLEELVDVVDEDDRVIATVTRARMRAERLLHRAVFIAVRHPDGRLLVHQRSPDKDLWPGRWDLAVGGVVAAGETYDQAAVRELAEEIGVTGAVPVPVATAAFRDDDVALLARCYTVTTAGPFHFADGEVVAADWVDVAELGRWAATRTVVPDSLALLRHLVPRTSG